MTAGVNALTATYGTSYTYGTTGTALCECYTGTYVLMITANF